MWRCPRCRREHATIWWCATKNISCLYNMLSCGSRNACPQTASSPRPCPGRGVLSDGIRSCIRHSPGSIGHGQNKRSRMHREWPPCRGKLLSWQRIPGVLVVLQWTLMIVCIRLVAVSLALFCSTALVLVLNKCVQHHHNVIQLFITVTTVLVVLAGICCPISVFPPSSCPFSAPHAGALMITSMCTSTSGDILSTDPSQALLPSELPAPRR